MRWTKTRLMLEDEIIGRQMMVELHGPLYTFLGVYWELVSERLDSN